MQLPLIQPLLVGAAERIVQAALAATPFLFGGLLLAGLLRAMTGPARLSAWFGQGRWSAPWRACRVAALAPVCSFSVLPLSRELHRAGVQGGAVIAFTLAAPMMNPVTLIYGLTVMDPWLLAGFALASLAVSWFAGVWWNLRFGSQLATVPTDEGIPPTPARRLGLAGWTAAHELAGPLGRDLLLGLCGVGLLAVCNPPHFVRDALHHSNAWAGPLLGSTAICAYLSPERAVMTMGTMCDVGNAYAAVLALMVFGAGVNLASLVWLGRTYGWRPLAECGALVVALTLALGFVADVALPHPQVDDGDTHALDILARHYALDALPPWQAVWHKARHSLRPAEAIALVVLSLWGIGGWLGRRRHDAILAWCYRETAGAHDAPDPRWYARPLPRGALQAFWLLEWAVLLLVGVYVYFPPIGALLEDMQVTRAEVYSAVSAADRPAALRQIERFQALAAKVEVSAWLRRDQAGLQLQPLQDALEQALARLAAAVTAGDDALARRECTAVLDVYSNLRQQYGQPTAQAPPAAVTERS